MSFGVHLTKQEILYRLFSVDGILHEFGIFEDEEFAVFWLHPYDCLVIHTEDVTAIQYIGHEHNINTCHNSTMGLG
jgi:hypothetical protein